MLDIHRVEIAGGLGDRAGNGRNARGLAVDIHQAHGDTANRDFGSVHQHPVLAKSAEPLVKIIQSRAETHRQPHIYLVEASDDIG